MKKLGLFFTVVFLVGATVSAKTTNAPEDNSSANAINRGYGNSFIFNEGGIEFSVFPDGQFDFYAPNYGPDVNVSVNTPNVSFSFNSGYDYSPYLQYDDFGAIIQIENTPIYYDYYGRVSQIGNVDINYTNYGRVARIGSLYVHYNNYRTFTHYTGFINTYNRVYVYRPWHVYYAVPAPSYCIVYARPYRQYYEPVRHHYYRPYTDNYRQPVRYTHRNASYSNGHRGDISNSSRVSDRYRQDASIDRNRTNSNVARSNATGGNLADTRVRTASRTSNENASSQRLNQSNRGVNNTRLERPSTSSRGNQSERMNNSDRNVRTSTTDRSNQGQRENSLERKVRGTTATNENQGERASFIGRNERAISQRSGSGDRYSQVAQRQTGDRNASAIAKNTQRVKSLPTRKPSDSNTRISSNKQQQRQTTQRSNSESAKKQSNSRSTSRRGNL